MGLPSLGATFHGSVFKGVEDLGFTHQTLTLTQEVIGEVSLQDYRDSLCMFNESCIEVYLLV